MRKTWDWVLLRNPAGLTCLATAWGVGVAYALAALAGLIGDANVPMALTFCGIAGLVLFVAVPILQTIFKA